MLNSSGASLDRAFEELIQRIVESTLAPVRSDLARLSSQVAAAPSAPVPVSGAAAGDGRVAAIQQAMYGILAPTSQTDIMAAALKSAAAAAGRAALFVRRGDSFTTWRSEGLDADAASLLRTLTGSAAAGAFRDICEGPRSVIAAETADTWPAGMSPLAGSGGIALLPILVAGKVVAAIAASADGTQDSAASLDIISRMAGLSLETSGARGPAAAPAMAPSVPQPAPEPPAHAPAAEPLAAAPAPPDNSRGSFAEMAPAAGASAQEPTPDISGLPEADQDAHKKAHRFARVAVQDLISYHKNKIADGRNNRNLYDLLREDIEKTRENYQKKFASTAAAAFDYLHYEMVAKLAGNDPAVLGANYPGPVSG